MSVLGKHQKLEQTKKIIPSQTSWKQRQSRYHHHLQATKIDEVARSS
jgi:hypothetical protein